MSVWLVVNVHSGSYDAARCERFGALFAEGGRTISQKVDCPEHDLPCVAQLREAGAETVAIFTGDGTINALARQLAGWDGEVLVLPGGTMNLLSKRLHGDVDAETIIRRFTGGRFARAPAPVVEGAGEQALVGVIAGPTTAWGQVRESMRHLEIGKLVEAVPAAWTQTFAGDPVRIEGQEASFPALHLEPREEGILATGFTAEGVGEVFAHGFAWLGGDFRKGPHVELGCERELAVGHVAGGGRLGLLVDGEKAEADAPCRFVLGRSGVDLVSTRPDGPAGT